LTGCASAYYLSKSGARVVVLERGQLNQGASGQNAGSLHFQLEHRLIQDPGLNVRELELHVGLARMAIEQWRGIDLELGAKTELGMNGGLMVAETPAEMALLERKLQIEQSQGLAVEMLDADAVQTLAPYLSKNIRAALFCADEGHCNPRLLTPAYARKAAEFGATFVTGATVRGLRCVAGGWQVAYDQTAYDQTAYDQPARADEKATIHCEVLLNAAGAWAAEIGAMANIHLPLSPAGLTMNATEKTDPRIPHLIQHIGRKLSLKQTEGGNLLIGGGWEAPLRRRAGQWSSVGSPEIKLDMVAGNLRAAVHVVPMIRSLRLLRTWAGITVLAPDLLPILGEAEPAHGFYVAAGGTGFTYGPTYARLISERILTGTSSYPLDPFSPARFGGVNAVTGRAS
jgi:glycine/D-amino acid oxidase-like deaminating enzyme